MYCDGLREACEEYGGTGTLPGRVYRRGDVPVHPEQGYYIERAFDPFELKRHLLSIGFDSCRVRSSFAESRTQPVLRLCSIVPLRIMFQIAPDFCLLARR